MHHGPRSQPPTRLLAGRACPARRRTPAYPHHLAPSRALARFARRFAHRPRLIATVSRSPSLSSCALRSEVNLARPHTSISWRIAVPNTAVVIVCLPKATPRPAGRHRHHRTRVNPAEDSGPAGHFPISTRLRGRLVQPGTTPPPADRSGCSTWMRCARPRRNAHWYRWHIWQRVVEGTRPAQPFWQFADRHRPNRPIQPRQAQQHYLAQPRSPRCVLQRPTQQDHGVADQPPGSFRPCPRLRPPRAALRGPRRRHAHPRRPLPGRRLRPARRPTVLPGLRARPPEHPRLP